MVFFAHILVSLMFESKIIAPANLGGIHSATFIKGNKNYFHQNTRVKNGFLVKTKLENYDDFGEQV